MADILIKKSDTPGAVPTPGQLTYDAADGAELAVNLADKKLYAKNSGGTVIQLGAGVFEPVDATILRSANIGVDVQAYDANKPAFPAGLSTAELGYLDGVTSAIQAQLDGKASTAAGTITTRGLLFKPTAFVESSGYWICNETGLIIQWGRVNTGGNNGTITFPIAFPNNMFNISLTIHGGGGSNGVDTCIIARNLGNSLTSQNWSFQPGNGRAGINYIAIGN